MFVNLVIFPTLKKGKDKEFREWFRESNRVYQGFEGFISRRLLQSEDGRYAAVVEHKSKDTFMRMHTSEERNDLFDKVEPILEGRPKPSFYNTVDL